MIKEGVDGYCYGAKGKYLQILKNSIYRKKNIKKNLHKIKLIFD